MAYGSALETSDLYPNWTPVRTAGLSGGATSTGFAYRRSGDWVEFTGKISGFAGAVFTLPANYRPGKAVTVNCYNGYIDITTAGVMTTSGSGAMMLEGAKFAIVDTT